jgi:hypothetical protein
MPVGVLGSSSRAPRARLGLEVLERRDNPSAWGDFWGGVAYYGGAFVEGLGEGATNIVTGARDAVVETVRTGGDLITIYTTDADKLDPAQLNSKLFQGAAQTAGNPAAAAQFDRQLVFGVATLGVGPLVQSGVHAVQTGDSTEFSKQAGGFGIMVLVPYGAGKGIAYLRGGAAAEGAVAAEAAGADAAGTVRAGALAGTEGEFNALARGVRFVEGAAPAEADLAIVNQRLALARQVLAEEVQRLEALESAGTLTAAEEALLRAFRNDSCAEAAVQLENAIRTGTAEPVNPAAMRQVSARDLVYAFDEASATPPFRGAPADLAPMLAERLPTPGQRALVVLERADGKPGHVLNAENVNGTIYLYESYSGQGASVAGQPAGVVAVEVFYPVGELAPSGGYSVVVVWP